MAFSHCFVRVLLVYHFYMHFLYVYIYIFFNVVLTFNRKSAPEISIYIPHVYMSGVETYQCCLQLRMGTCPCLLGSVLRRSTLPCVQLINRYMAPTFLWKAVCLYIYM